VLDIYSLTEEGHLLGYPVGRKIHALIDCRLLRLPRGSVLLVDLSRVRQVSHAALREMLSVFAAVRTAELEQRYLLLHVDVSNRELIESLEILARDRGDVIPVINQTGSWHVLGKLTKSERDTLSMVLEHEEMTSARLGAGLHLPASAASNRLRRLYELRLVQREERLISQHGGREFVYRSLIPW
jgi:hypothetical protein